MMHKILKFIMGVALITLSVGGVSAQELRYISDILYVKMKAEPGTGENLELLKSNSQVEVIETQDQYLKVLTDTGNSGWIPAKYVTADLPKSMIIDRMKKELEKQQAELNRYRKDNGPLLGELKTITENYAQAEKTMAEMQQTYTQKMEILHQQLANKQAEAIKIASQLQEVTEEYNGLSKEVQVLRQFKASQKTLDKKYESVHSRLEQALADNTQLKRSEYLKWFISGAGVLLTGWLIGKVPRKKKYFESRLV
jgi:SH3 domain protein